MRHMPYSQPFLHEYGIASYHRKSAALDMKDIKHRKNVNDCFNMEYNSTRHNTTTAKCYPTGLIRGLLLAN